MSVASIWLVDVVKRVCRGCIVFLFYEYSLLALGIKSGLPYCEYVKYKYDLNFRFVLVYLTSTKKI
jgi:hypothetical protein